MKYSAAQPQLLTCRVRYHPFAAGDPAANPNPVITTGLGLNGLLPLNDTITFPKLCEAKPSQSLGNTKAFGVSGKSNRWDKPGARPKRPPHSWCHNINEQF